MSIYLLNLHETVVVKPKEYIINYNLLYNICKFVIRVICTISSMKYVNVY